MSDYQILSQIESPKDIKNLSQKELSKLTEEVRQFLIENISKTGGHFASNLGIVELTLALHRVFDSPNDKFIFDVGHQCYTHKILTGRKHLFEKNRQFGGMSGFTRRYESPHDFVDAGHASTSISSALGILLGEELQGNFNYIIPIIGDASLTGGMAYEAMNHLGHLKKKMIIVLNDNNMSIDGSVGAMSSSLSKLTTTRGYQRFRRFADFVMLHIPFIGKQFYSMIMRWKKSVKTFFYKSNIFTDLGLKYIGPIDGHNLKELETIFTRVKLLNEPVLIHIITKKGKGYELAEKFPDKYHGVSTFDPELGVKGVKTSTKTFTQAFSDTIIKYGEMNDRIVAITAAMMTGTGLTQFFNKYPKRSFDVGITEEHAVTMAAGMAIAGMKPVVAIYSTFIQRSVDQIIHDVAIPGLPVTFVLDRAGIVPADGEAHQGLFDISLLKSIPGITIMAPATASELDIMFEYALTLKNLSVIRYPKDFVIDDSFTEIEELNKGILITKNKYQFLIITYGELVNEAKIASEILESKGISCDVYSLRILSPLADKDIQKLLKSYRMVVVLEDAIVKGGIGEEIQSTSRGINPNIYILGVNSSFLTHGSRMDLKKICKLDGESVAEFIIEKSDEVRHNEVVERIKNKW